MIVPLSKKHNYPLEMEKAAVENSRILQKENVWIQYLTCEKLPNPANAAELREFLFRWNCELEDMSKHTTSWTLDINDRSPLTQDESVPLMTREVLKSQRGDVGSLYLRGIESALKILSLIDDSAQMNILQNEVVKVRDEIRQKLANVLDEITLRVGGNISRDMT